MNENNTKKKNAKIEAYFEKKKKRQRRKKKIFVSFIFISLLAIFLCKSPLWGIKKVNILGNKFIKEQGVIDSKNIIGKNIFLLDTNSVKNNVLENPYIKQADIKRKFPNELNIIVEERKMFYKVEVDSKKYVLNNELYIMEIIDNDENLELVEIKGLAVDTLQVGEKITKDQKSIDVLYDVATKLIDKNEKNIFTYIDISKNNHITIFSRDMEIVLGKAENLDGKYLRALEIINSDIIGTSINYIDVSVINNPVVREKKENIENN
ncbi:MAG: cell division protein FtsQ/DivIB [Sarcina sp.]